MQAHPLKWPDGYPRTFQPKTASFKVSLATARDHLLDQIEKLGGTSVVISSNAVLKRDGLPAAKQPATADTGVAVYFFYHGQQVVLPCDRWDEIAANLRAIGLTVEAMRGMERWGVGQMLKRAFSGFQALPPPPGGGSSARTTPPPPDARTWQEVLGIRGVQTWDRVTEAYKKRRVETHPDKPTGSTAEFQAVQNAYEQAKKKFGMK